MPTDTHTIANAQVLVTLDPRGNLAALVNRQTGLDYVAGQPAPFWRLFYAHPDDPETPILATDQEPAEVAAAGETLTVRYPHLRDFVGRPVAAELRFELHLGGEELILTAELENHGAPDLCELWFPMVGPLGSLGPAPEAAFLLYPESAGRRVLNPLANLYARDTPPVRGNRFTGLRDYYPGRAAMQWLGLYGAGGSLYLGSHDASLQTTTVCAMLNVAARAADDSLSLGFIKYPFCRPGERWRSAPFILAVHRESWHRDARRYRAFADTYQDHRRDKPQWVRLMPGMQDVVMLHQFGRVNFRYDQIGEIAAAAATGGIDVIKLTGWSEGGHDNHYPDFRPSDRLGGEARLAQGLHALSAAGQKTVLYYHFAQMSPNSDFYRAHGEFCAIKGPFGNPFVDIFTWPSHGSIIAMNERFQLINACPGTEPWYDQILDCVRRGLALGVDCVFLDQTAGWPGSQLCFDSRHGHRGPAWACGPGKTRISAAARELVRARGPEVALGAEYVADVILQYYDFSLPFGMGFLYGGQHFGELYRYTFPEDILCTQYMSREDFAQLHYSFAMGFRFFLAPGQQCEVLTSLAPAFVQRLAALVALRRRHADVLLEGRYLDLTPLDPVPSGLVARAYEGNGAAGVAVWNPTPQPQPLAVTWPGRRLAVIETPAGALAPGADLAPDDVAVLRFA